MCLAAVALYFAWDWYGPQGYAAVEYDGRRVKYLHRVTAEAGPEAELPMIIFLHGYGGRAHHHPSDFKAAFFPARLIFPRAPFARHTSWYDPEEREETLPRAAEMIAGLTRALTERYPTKGKPVLYGFSQGGVTALYCAIWYPSLYSAVLAEGAFLDASFLPSALNPAEEYPPVYQFHGTKDMIILLEEGQRTAAALRGLGVPGRFYALDAGHRCLYDHQGKIIFDTLAEVCP